MPWRIETKVSEPWEEEEQWVVLVFRPRKRGRFETAAEAEETIRTMQRSQPHAIFRPVWYDR